MHDRRLVAAEQEPHVLVEGLATDLVSQRLGFGELVVVVVVLETVGYSVSTRCGCSSTEAKERKTTSPLYWGIGSGRKRRVDIYQ